MIVKTFTDVYGDIHTDKPVEVVQAYFDSSESRALNKIVDGNDYVNAEVSSDSSESNNLRFNLVFWDSEQDRLDNKLPRILLAPVAVNMNFTNETPVPESALDTRPLQDRVWFEVRNIPSDLIDSERVEATVENYLNLYL